MKSFTKKLNAAVTALMVSCSLLATLHDASAVSNRSHTGARAAKIVSVDVAEDQIEYQSPSTQTAVTGAEVTTPPSVTVRDAFGNNVSGVEVQFAVGNGNGTILDGTDETLDITIATGSNGVATVDGWKLPDQAGVYTLTASNPNYHDSPLTFTATASQACTDGKFCITTYYQKLQYVDDLSGPYYLYKVYLYKNGTNTFNTNGDYSYDETKMHLTFKERITTTPDVIVYRVQLNVITFKWVKNDLTYSIDDIATIRIEDGAFTDPQNSMTNEALTKTF